MKNSSITHALVIDLEATCCNRGSLTKNDIEIIEIGAFLVELSSLTTTYSFHSYVQPVKSSKITPFCRRLTGIQQSDVDEASEFPDVAEELFKNIDDFSKVVFACWSNFDWRQMRKDCVYHKIKFPFQNQYWDLQKLFRQKQKLHQNYSVKGALTVINEEFEGREHSAYYDALNTAKLVSYCL